MKHGPYVGRRRISKRTKFLTAFNLWSWLDPQPGQVMGLITHDCIGPQADCRRCIMHDTSTVVWLSPHRSYTEEDIALSLPKPLLLNSLPPPLPGSVSHDCGRQLPSQTDHAAG